MPVNTEKDIYKWYKPIWQKCRDVVSGQEAIHMQGTLYLPALNSQSTEEYNAYLTRSVFYGATQRTVDAMTGLLFRKAPVINLPPMLEEWANDINLNGITLSTFCEDLANEVLEVGRCGVLVDYPVSNQVLEPELTQNLAQNLNLRPFFVKYTTENIINWRKSTINNQSILDLLVLKEYIEVPIDEFETNLVVHYRVLDLFEGKYRQRLFREIQDSSQKTSFLLVYETFPVMNNSNMDRIPFVFFSSKNASCEISKPPILDLVNVNLSHYLTTADLEHGAHFTGLPTAVIKGHRLGENEKLKIGSSEAWVFSEPEADAFYLEFAGTGLSALETRLEKKEQQMAALGARLLVNEKASAETAEAHSIKRQGENSALSSIAESLDDGIMKALEIMAQWGNISGDISFKINKDFIPVKMEAQELLALLQVWQTGGISFADFIDNLKKGEIIDSERTPEDIKAELEIEGPTLMAENSLSSNQNDSNAQ